MRSVPLCLFNPEGTRANRTLCEPSRFARGFPAIEEAKRDASHTLAQLLFELGAAKTCQSGEQGLP
jgi:hypothetical protein